MKRAIINATNICSGFTPPFLSLFRPIIIHTRNNLVQKHTSLYTVHTLYTFKCRRSKNLRMHTIQNRRPASRLPTTVIFMLKFQASFWSSPFATVVSVSWPFSATSWSYSWSPAPAPCTPSPTSTLQTWPLRTSSLPSSVSPSSSMRHSFNAGTCPNSCASSAPSPRRSASTSASSHSS